MSSLIRENHFTVQQDGLLSTFLIATVQFIHSLERVQDFLAAKRLSINGACVQEDVLVKAGDVITLLTAQEDEPPVSDDIKIVFEDDALLVIDKSAPLPMHPAGRYWFNTLTSILARRFPDVQLFSVHRLDSETSGLVVFAKSAQYANSLRKQFISRAVQKRYVAIVHGVPKPTKGIIKQPLLATTYGGIRNKMLPSDVGQLAITAFEVRGSTADNRYAHLRLMPQTGRKHQLRVHLASIGHPIVGDKVYGAYPELFERYVDNPRGMSQEILQKLGSARHLLHCEQLDFKHPKNGKIVSLTSKIRPDMLIFLKKRDIDSF